MSTPAVPTFRFEENRLVYSLRVIAYPGDAFTSEESCRCAFAVTAIRAGNRSAPGHEKNLDEWSRVVDLLGAAEPKAWVEGERPAAAVDASPKDPVTEATEARIEQAEDQFKRARATQL